MIASNLSSHLYVILTVVFTVYSQLVSKWQVTIAGQLPTEFGDKVVFLLRLLFNPWIMSGFFCAFLAALSWMAAMTRLPLSYAYPIFVSLTFFLVVTSSLLLFKEPFNLAKALSITLIVAGIVIGSQS